MIVPTNTSHSTYYLLASAYNTLIIPFSKFFSSNLGAIDPLFSPSGCFLILLWGCSYASVYKLYKHVPLLLAVFATEKAFYGLRWMCWMKQEYSGLMDLIREDFVTGLFFSVYGVGDLIFAVFFAYSAFIYWESTMERKSAWTFASFSCSTSRKPNSFNTNTRCED